MEPPLTFVPRASPNFRAAEFFAGIGLARLGLERSGVGVVWSNDISAQKERVFTSHFGESANHEFALQDLGTIPLNKLPQRLDMAWASFPCTDLSLAGGRAGLHRGTSSSTFWHFIKALSALGEGRPRLVVLENVTAFATSHSGKDIESAIRALNGLGYSVDVLSIDAKRFVPQSRPRLFLVASLNPPESNSSASDLRPGWLDSIFQNHTLRTHQAALPPAPLASTERLRDVVEHFTPDDSRWWDEERVGKFIASLSPHQFKRFELLRHAEEPSYRTGYRRMRDGKPRWELRADDIAGCLRTARGGSSKQAVAVLGGGNVHIRWMTPLEYARLMGAGDYSLKGIADGEAFNGFGDAVCVPVVEWLAAEYLVPELQRTARGESPDTAVLNAENVDFLLSKAAV
ncbi:DNA cytosine methyltransferase [Cryobacterium zongtaii]|uniref:DNA cytosine methyltransferase n=1 Tax=Cryobacterium zongtaii TaxID=1259217 RepID=UPI000CD4790E|nr:DNA (cytosine-5-)-methyltransferase [Cryobacterium zongtaii]TFC47316.1 DNA cytosine methyltransferase [Cryobacterium sp. TMN-39-2]